MSSFTEEEVQAFAQQFILDSVYEYEYFDLIELASDIFDDDNEAEVFAERAAELIDNATITVEFDV